MSLLYIGQQITIYGGLFTVIVGVVGNGMNILVFSSVRNYRKNPCTFYYLIASIYNIAFLIINLMSRILSVGYGIDLTRTSITWCKMKTFIGISISLISLNCSCLATIDQFFATSQSVYIRRLSNMKWAHRIVFIVNIVWCVYGIPVLLFYDISPITKSCVVTNSDYTIYFTIYVIGFLCTIPALVMVVFGYLGYRNIHLRRSLAEQQADRQLTRMTLIQVVLVLVCFVPFDINNVYNLITSSISKNTNRLMIENLAYTIFTLMSYFYYAVCLLILCKIINQILFQGSCYMFLISSSRFRRATKIEYSSF
jgi:hypothetical protein